MHVSLRSAGTNDNDQSNSFIAYYTEERISSRHRKNCWLSHLREHRSEHTIPSNSTIKLNRLLPIGLAQITDYMLIWIPLVHAYTVYDVNKSFTPHGNRWGVDKTFSRQNNVAWCPRHKVAWSLKNDNS